MSPSSWTATVDGLSDAACHASSATELELLPRGAWSSVRSISAYAR
jgi:hypothetical protein